MAILLEVGHKENRIQNMGFLVAQVLCERLKTHRSEWMIFLPFYKYGWNTKTGKNRAFIRLKTFAKI